MIKYSKERKLKITKKEKIIINCAKFIKDINFNFKDVEDVSIVLLPNKEDEFGEKYPFNPKNEVYPLKVTIISEGKTKRYSFISSTFSDDEYPLTTNLEESIGFWEFRTYIKQNLKELLTKSAYDEFLVINSDNIERLLEPVLSKVSAIELNKKLPKSKLNTKKLKI